MEKESDYLVRNAKMIYGYLTDLVKNKCIIAANFGEDNASFLTTIVELDQKTNLLALDVAPNEQLNRQLLTSAKVLFRTEFDGIKVSFRGKAIKKAERNGAPVLAMPLPDALFWMQRRQYYRVKIPLSHKNSFCEIEFRTVDEANNPQSLSGIFPLADLSISGFAMLVNDTKFSEFLQPGAEHADCALYLNDGSRANIGIVVRDIATVRAGAAGKQQRVGCQFTQVSQMFESSIQRYVQDIERQQKNIG